MSRSSDSHIIPGPQVSKLFARTLIVVPAVDEQVLVSHALVHPLDRRVHGYHRAVDAVDHRAHGCDGAVDYHVHGCDRVVDY